VHRSTALRHVALELLEKLRQMGHGVLLERTTGCAQLFPVLAFRHRRKPFRADRGGGVPDVAAQLTVAERAACGDRERVVAAKVADTGCTQKRAHREPGAPWSVSVEARISA